MNVHASINVNNSVCTYNKNNFVIYLKVIHIYFLFICIIIILFTNTHAKNIALTQTNKLNESCDAGDVKMQM